MNGSANGNGFSNRTALITGGAGFIGTNLAHRLLNNGMRVIIFDNLSRRGVEENLRWLIAAHGRRVEALIADIGDLIALERATQRADLVFHLAAQVAVTSSLINPTLDFETNAQGTLNLLEVLRGLNKPPALIYTSTNKVYGSISDLELVEGETRYDPAPASRWKNGISEAASLDFHSPYGCSKGIADQYVLDFARSYGLRTLVFRMSCIYGPHQFGTEDQGWVAHFARSAIAGKPITLYGNGRQVRDLLYVEDLIDAFVMADHAIDRLSGSAYNIGGGIENTTSLIDLLDMFEDLGLPAPVVDFTDWRTGDQRYYVSDISRFQAATGWKPRTNIRDGLRRLHDWLLEAGAYLKPVESGERR